MKTTLFRYPIQRKVDWEEKKENGQMDYKRIGRDQ